MEGGFGPKMPPLKTLGAGNWATRLFATSQTSNLSEICFVFIVLFGITILHFVKRGILNDVTEGVCLEDQGGVGGFLSPLKSFS